jgi:hypothetical protein
VEVMRSYTFQPRGGGTNCRRRSRRWGSAGPNNRHDGSGSGSSSSRGGSRRNGGRRSGRRRHCCRGLGFRYRFLVLKRWPPVGSIRHCCLMSSPNAKSALRRRRSSCYSIFLLMGRRISLIRPLRRLLLLRSTLDAQRSWNQRGWRVSSVWRCSSWATQ